MKKTKTMRAFVKPMTHLWMMETGWGNGYVVIPKEHPLHGKACDDIDVDVHCGLTFAENVNDLDWSELISKDKDGWVIGFDTTHLDDNLTKWPENAVMAEANKLKAQLEQLTL